MFRKWTEKQRCTSICTLWKRMKVHRNESQCIITIVVFCLLMLCKQYWRWLRDAMLLCDWLFNSDAIAIKTKRYRYNTCAMRSSDADWEQQVMSDSHLYEISDRIRTLILLHDNGTMQFSNSSNIITQFDAAWKYIFVKVQAWFRSMLHQRDTVKKIVLHCWRHYCFYAMFESRVSIIGIVIWMIHLSIITLKTERYCMKFD